MGRLRAWPKMHLSQGFPKVQILHSLTRKDLEPVAKAGRLNGRTWKESLIATGKGKANALAMAKLKPKLTDFCVAIDISSWRSARLKSRKAACRNRQLRNMKLAAMQVAETHSHLLLLGFSWGLLFPILTPQPPPKQPSSHEEGTLGAEGYNWVLMPTQCLTGCPVQQV